MLSELQSALRETRLVPNQTGCAHEIYTGGCLFSREKAVKDVKSRVRFCFLVGVNLDLDWLRKN